MFDFLDSFKPNAHWLLRIALASVFIFHGWGKVMNLGGFSEMLGLSTTVVALVAFAELAGGIRIIAGAFTKDLITRLSGLALVPVLLGAIFMVHWGRWNFVPAEDFPMGGMEFQVVLLLMALYFLVMGNAGVNRAS